jgi:hypothetical protein
MMQAAATIIVGMMASYKIITAAIVPQKGCEKI